MLHSPIHDKGSNLSDTEGKRLEKRAITQEEVITEFLTRHRGRPYTSWEIWRALGEQYPITSIRRALSNLTEKGVLIKREDIKKEGKYDAQNNTWLIPAGKQLDLL